MRTAPVLIALTVLLAGCTAAPSPEPSAPNEPPSPSPTTTAAAPELPELEQVMTLLDSSPDDDRPPPARLGVVLEPDEPQTLTDAREQTTGPGVVRVGCSSVDGVPVTVAVEIAGVAQGEFEAQCGEAPNVSFVTQEARFDFASPYTFTVSSSVATVVAIGVVPD